MSTQYLGIGPRTRSTRVAPDSIEGLPRRYYSNTGTTVNYPDRVFECDACYETMTDYYSSSPPPWPFRPMSHKKWEFEWIGMGSRSHGSSSCKVGRVDTIFYHPYDLNSSLGEDDVCPRICNLSDYYSDIATMLNQALDVIKAPTDALVFLAEFHEVTHLAKDVLKAYNVLKAIAGVNLDTVFKAIKVMKMSGASLFHGIIVEAANDLLSYSFGWRPFVSDVLGLSNRIFRLHQRLEELKKGEGKLLKSYRSKNLRVSIPEEEVLSQSICSAANSGNYCWAGGPSAELKHLRRNDVISHPHISVTVAYRYSLPPDLTKVSDHMGLLLSMVGIRPSLATAWELIPFSFVLDWILPVESWLDRVGTLDISGVNVDILDVCASVTSARRSSLAYRFPCRYGNGPVNYCVATRSDVEREVGKELLDALPSFRLPTGFQSLLGAALLIAKR